MLAPAKFALINPLHIGDIQLVEPSLGSELNLHSPYVRMREGSKTLGLSQRLWPSSGKTLTEILFDTRSSLKIKTAEVAMHLHAGWRELLFRQLDNLHDVEEWDVRDRPTEIGSFVTFLRLILHIRPDKKPGIGLTSSGHLIAGWAHQRDRLTIECLPNDQVRWVLVRWDGDDRESAAGSTSLLRLAAALEPYKPSSWFVK